MNLSQKELTIDKIDLALLRALHDDVQASQRVLAERVGLSHNACWRRLQRLKATGLWRGSRAVVDPAALGFDLTVIVMIKTTRHSSPWTEAFRDHVERLPGVTELHRIGGEWDYCVKVITRGMAGYDAFYRQLVDGFDLVAVTGHFVMERLVERDLPVEALGG